MGVHNARVGTPGGTLGPRERARFDAPMTYEIAPAPSRRRTRVFSRLSGKRRVRLRDGAGVRLRRRLLRRVLRHFARETKPHAERRRPRRRPRRRRPRRRRRRDRVSRRGPVRVLRVGRSPRRAFARGDARVPLARPRESACFSQAGYRADVLRVGVGRRHGVRGRFRRVGRRRGGRRSRNRGRGLGRARDGIDDDVAPGRYRANLEDDARGPARARGGVRGSTGTRGARRHIRRRRDQPRTIGEEDGRVRARKSPRSRPRRSPARVPSPRRRQTRRGGGGRRRR